jgi:hypothetical protein
MWITDRKPRKDELKVTFERTNYTRYGEVFLVWDGKHVTFDSFEMPPNGKTWYEGYWLNNEENYKAWMPVPEPPEEVK